MLVAVGMFLLVLWRLFDLFLGHHEDDGADLWKHRASDLLKAVLYGTICWSAISVLMRLRRRRLGREGLLLDDPRACPAARSGSR